MTANDSAVIGNAVNRAGDGLVGLWVNERYGNAHSAYVRCDGTIWSYFDFDGCESWVKQELGDRDGYEVARERFSGAGWVHSDDVDDVPRFVTDVPVDPYTVCDADTVRGWLYDGCDAVIRYHD